MAKIKKDKKAKVVKVAKNSVTPTSLLTSFMQNAVDDTEKALQIVGASTIQSKLSTGVLTYDLIIGGGITPGMYTTSGPEQSAKSTVGVSVLRQALLADIPVVMFFNAEGTLDSDYTSRIFRVKSMSSLLGERDKTGNWIVTPRMRYYTENVLEVVFKTIQRTLNQLPDKVFLPERDKWYLVFDRTKASMAQMKALNMTSDSKLFSKTGRYYCETDDTRPQAVINIDSYPSLVTREVMEEESEGNGLALDARAFSKYVKRVSGLLASKQVVLWGINQLRTNPMDKYNPIYEPCGEALKFYSKNRCRVNKRAVSGVKVGPGAWDESEKSVIYPGKHDTYHYKHIKNVKNKGGTPQLEGWFRIWVDDSKGKGYGIDPVFDVYSFLVLTGQIKGDRRRGFNILFANQTAAAKELAKITFTWDSFKLAILTETKHVKVEKPVKDKKAKKADKKSSKLPLQIRQECFKQLKDGSATDLFAHARNSGDDMDDLEDDE